MMLILDGIQHINVPKSEISYTVSSNGGCDSFLIQNSMDGWMVCAPDLDRSAKHFKSCPPYAAFEHVRLSFVNNSLRTLCALSAYCGLQTCPNQSVWR
jgi:hypothetical protein